MNNSDVTKASPFPPPSAELEYLLSTRAVRERAQRILQLALEGKTHFSVERARLAAVADFVADVTRQNYPDLKVPFHSRWRHFQAGGIDRNGELQKSLAARGVVERVRSKIDLAIVSVLLDAGAGPKWSYREKESGQSFARSEGLAVATFRAFMGGLFSSNPQNPYQVDADGLDQLSPETFAQSFQVGPQNPLVGLSGRFELMRSIGKALRQNSEFLGSKPPRPAGLLEHLRRRSSEGELAITQVLTALQHSLGLIWPGRVVFQGVNLGDVWPYAPLGSGPEALIPFHKLPQWLTLSLVDPLVESGLLITDFDELTPLAEYRNGGLLLDMGVLQARDPKILEQAHKPSSEIVVEWRALTVALLEELARPVRERLNLSAQELPLGKILEGGTWWAGRKVAQSLRADGSPPLKIDSDGTVF